jgi:hypothetical protein
MKRGTRPDARRNEGDATMARFHTKACGPLVCPGKVADLLCGMISTTRGGRLGESVWHPATEGNGTHTIFT